MKAYYEHGGIQIFNADCREVLPTIERVDLLLTDPPYGVKRDKGFDGFGGFGAPIARRRFESDDWDSERPNIETFTLCLSLAKNAEIGRAHV